MRVWNFCPALGLVCLVSCRTEDGLGVAQREWIGGKPLKFPLKNAEGFIEEID